MVFPVSDPRDVIVRQSFFVLPEVVVALTGAHVKEGTTTGFLLHALRLLMFILILIEEGGAEIVKRPFIVVHHHVTFSPLVKCQGEI